MRLSLFSFWALRAGFARSVFSENFFIGFLKKFSGFLEQKAAVPKLAHHRPCANYVKLCDLQIIVDKPTGACYYNNVKRGKTYEKKKKIFSP